MANKELAPSWVEVSSSALRHNLQALRRHAAGDGPLMTVVKSNAYGHGLKEVVAAVGPLTDWFGVVSWTEAEEIRRRYRRKPILIMGFVPSTDLRAAVAADCVLGVGDIARLKELAGLATERHPIKVHLKIETGTSRLGFHEEELPSVARLFMRHRNLLLDGAFTHLADVEDTDDSGYAREQMRRFEAALQTLAACGLRPRWRHVAASGAALLYPEGRFDMVRLGVSAYGLWPSASLKARLDERLALKPALAWKAVVVQVKAFPRGTPVSYGLTEVLKRDSRLAVLPVGYYEGYDRGLSSAGHVLIRGQRAKITGRVCMNMCMADVTDIKGARIGDEAVLIGRQGREQVTAEELADRIGTINYEVVARLNPQLPRLLVA
jgi:alanine racemase